VPLIIHHPQSPFKGMHYTAPVELIDIYPTIRALSLSTNMFNESLICRGKELCKALQGKNLAPAILGERWKQFRRRGRAKSSSTAAALDQLSQSPDGPANATMPSLRRNFAISQSWRCISFASLRVMSNSSSVSVRRSPKHWKDCNRDDNDNGKGQEELSVMGYSMRTVDFRYTAWLPFNRSIMAVSWDEPVYEEELYDHRGERPEDFTHLEVVNEARNPDFAKQLLKARRKLLDFLKKNLVFFGPYPKNR